MKPTKTDRLTLVFTLSLFVMSLFMALSPFLENSADVRENTLRLHIIANSDSETDQANKLAVRDEILFKYGEALSAGKSIESAVYVTEKLIGDITLTAKSALREAGCDYDVTASVEEMYFDTIDYGGEVMPAGNYKALRIVIGEGEGHNWWCVMYPSLCLPAVSKEPETADEERIRLLNTGANLTAKFAFVELWESVKNTLSI